MAKSYDCKAGCHWVLKCHGPGCCLLLQGEMLQWLLCQAAESLSGSVWLRPHHEQAVVSSCGWWPLSHWKLAGIHKKITSHNLPHPQLRKNRSRQGKRKITQRTHLWVFEHMKWPLLGLCCVIRPELRALRDWVPLPSTWTWQSSSGSAHWRNGRYHGFGRSFQWSWRQIQKRISLQISWSIPASGHNV